LQFKLKYALCLLKYVLIIRANGPTFSANGPIPSTLG
jgi:hypothetical protein